MKTSIHRLNSHRPDDISEAQWECCIDWSLHLIGNSAAVPSWMPTSDLRRIQEEFDAKIDEGPDLATIGWLWDEFKHSSKIDYQRFRIQWEEAPADGDGYHERYNERVREK